MNKKVFYWAVVLGLSMACSRADVEERGSLSVSADVDDEIVFSEATISPEVYQKQSSRALPTDNAIEWLDDDNVLKSLGRTYWFKGEELVEEELKSPIFNVRTLIQDAELEGSVEVISRRQVEVRTQAYQDVRSTRTENRRRKKVGGGFSLSFLGFKIGTRSSHEKTFSAMREYFNTSMFGDADVLVTGKSVRISVGDATRARVIERHLYPRFVRELYNSPIGAVGKSVAPLVLCGYQMGGMVSARYLYKDAQVREIDSVYSSFGSGLNASFKFSKKLDDSSAELAFNKDGMNVFENKSELENIYVAISSIGGSPEFQVSLPVFQASELKGVNLDLSSWMKSLDDDKRHVVTEIQDKGLRPLSEFILEENFCRRLTDIYKGVLEENSKNLIPEIEIRKVFVREDASGAALCDVALVLNTRNGDKIILTPLNKDATDAELLSNDDRNVYMRKAKSLVRSYSSVFQGLKRSGRAVKVLRPYLRDELCIEAVVDFDRMYRYKNPNNQIVYLYDERNRVAFSYRQGDEGDADLEAGYGLSSLVQRLPEKKISIVNLLQNYKVIGL